MNKVWIPLLMAAAAIAGLAVGHISGKFSARNELNEAINSQQFFSYGYGGSKFQNIINLVGSHYVDSVDVDSLEEAFIPEFLKNLDPHSIYIPRKEVDRVAADLKSDFGGIGVTFSIINDTVCVTSIVSGGPSSAIGIVPGDRIIKVNGHDFFGKKISNQTVMDSLRGEIGSKVDLTILRKPDSQLQFSVTRGLIPLTSVDVSYEIAPGVGYMRIDRFAEKTYEEMMRGIAKLKSDGCKSLIVDLRGNSGGFLAVVAAMCNEFLDKKDLIVYTEGAHQARTNTVADGSGSCKDINVVVLIDEGSASASEIFSGAIQDNDRGVVIGRRSFGKGLVQREMTLPDQSVLRLTVERYHTPSGRCIQRPYANGTEEYYVGNAEERFSNGELFCADSIKADTSKVYHTKKGRVVYGGGGIIPDIFVPYDSARASAYLATLRSRRLIYDFAISYVESHRAQYDGLTPDALVRRLLSEKFFDALTSFASRRGVERPLSIDSKERQIMENEVRAYIGQAMANGDAFYPIIHITDPVIAKTLDFLGVKAKYSN